MSLQRDVALFAALARAAERENPGQHIVTFIFYHYRVNVGLSIPIHCGALCGVDEGGGTAPGRVQHAGRYGVGDGGYVVYILTKFAKASASGNSTGIRAKTASLNALLSLIHKLFS